MILGIANGQEISSGTRGVQASTSVPRRPDLPFKISAFIAGSAMVLGVLFDYLFYNAPIGISYFIFVLAFYTVFFGLAWRQIGVGLNFATFLFLPILLLSLSFGVFSNPLLRGINLFLIPFLLFIQTLLLALRSRFPWFDLRFVADFLNGKIIHTFQNLWRPYRIVISASNADPAAVAGIRRVLLGLLLSIPLALIVVSLLSSADAIFNEYLADLSNILDAGLRPFLSRSAIILCASTLLSGYFYTLLWMPACKPVEVRGESPRTLDSLIVSTILFVINAIYILFAVIQFSYLFGGKDPVSHGFMTYADYARHGFFELLVVTSINFTVMLVCAHHTRREGNSFKFGLRVLLSLLVVCTAVILYSAHFRLALYEEAYGYTYARLYAHSIMLWFALLFLMALYKIWVDRASFEKLAIIITLVLYLGLNYAGVDVLIARQNIERYRRAGRIDIAYLLKLSTEAVPVYAVLCSPGTVDEQVEGAVCDHLLGLRRHLAVDRRWQSFNLSKERARRVVVALGKG
ncbi:MAG: DUF4153 domain-containing protein [bacterium]